MMKNSPSVIKPCEQRWREWSSIATPPSRSRSESFRTTKNPRLGFISTNAFNFECTRSSSFITALTLLALLTLSVTVTVVLRISDLKTGVTRTSEHQLEVYSALFCLEYEIDPLSLRAIELRIYQDGSCRVYDGDPYIIRGIMDKIVRFDKILNRLREEVS
jgi:hypothetical protein